VDGTVILELRAQFHLEQLGADRELIGLMEALALELLGGGIRVEFRAAAGSAPTGAEPEAPSRAPDKDDLLEDGDGSTNPAEMVADMLGGEFVSE
jgi:hypothetical protein